MADKSFEEKVRDELQLLRLSPEAEVWNNIALALHKEKKRRWIIWFVFLAGIAGAGSFFALDRHGKMENGLHTNHVSALKQKPGSTDSAKIQMENIKSSTDRTAPAAISATAPASPEKQAGTGKEGMHNFTVTRTSGKQKADQKITNIHEAEQGVSVELNHFSNKEIAGKLVSGNSGETVQKENKTGQTDPVPVVSQEPAGMKRVPSITDSTVTSGAGMGMDTTTVISPKVKRPLTFFLAGTVGFSGVANSLGNGYLNSNSASSYSLPAGNVSNGLVHPVPNYTNAFSFGISFEVNKQLTGKSSVGLGLGYQFFQSAVSVGNRIDSTRNISLINGTNDHGFYYQDGGNNRYLNRYHFIDLSVFFYIQNKAGNRHPFRWKIGAGTNFLLASNALLYDPSSNILFSKNSLLQKVMLNASVGFDKGIGNPSFLYIGPRLSYFTGKLTAVNSTAPQHLFRASVNISVPLSKRKSKMQR